MLRTTQHNLIALQQLSHRFDAHALASFFGQVIDQTLLCMFWSTGYNDGYADNLSLVLPGHPLYLPLILR